MTAEDGVLYTAKADISWLAKGDYEYHFGIDTGDDTILFPEKTYCIPNGGTIMNKLLTPCV